MHSPLSLALPLCLSTSLGLPLLHALQASGARASLAQRTAQSITANGEAIWSVVRVLASFRIILGMEGATALNDLCTFDLMILILSSSI